MSEQLPQHPARQASVSGLAVAGLVLGVIAAVTSFLPIINNISFFLALIGLILAIVGLLGIRKGKHAGKGIAIAGIVLGIVSMVIVLATQSMFSAALKSSSPSASSSTPAAASTAAQTEAKSDAKAGGSQELGLGSTFEFDGFTFTLGDSYETTTLENQYSDLNGKTVLVIPVTVTNNNSDTKSVNLFYFKAFGPDGNELAQCYTYYMDTDLLMAGDMRSGATKDSYLHLVYTEDGDYVIELEDFKTKLEIKIPVAL